MSEELQNLLDAVKKQLEKENLPHVIVDYDEWWCPTVSDCLESLYDVAENPEKFKEDTKKYHEGRRRDYEEEEDED